MPGPIPLQKHGTTGQIQASAVQLCTQLMLGAAIADLQAGNTSHQLSAEGEMAAKGAAAVVHEHQGHCAILMTLAPLP